MTTYLWGATPIILAYLGFGVAIMAANGDRHPCGHWRPERTFRAGLAEPGKLASLSSAISLRSTGEARESYVRP